jgi:serine/threonine protein kinase/Tfp pilus assembly protein PilF
LTPQQRELADRLFAEAVALPWEQQPAFLARSTDPEVRREVESLLAFASRPPAGIAEAIEHAAGALATPDFGGLRVGPYRLTGRIGQGGMGAVYCAVRDDDQFRQTVAVKMLRFPDGDPAMLQRFLRERQVLAFLAHPHIARLLDGGAWVPPGSAEPQPYIVMEYVDGVPLTTYCEQEKATVAERLRLFRNVCDAVSYAHRQLVVHRDIKPGNILVTTNGAPKLLDFGVSKLLHAGMRAGAATLTSTDLLAMTPDYASPEQVRGEPVATLTDVYSLGAVIYELLTGRRPHQMATHDPLEIARQICEREVTPPGVDGELDMIVLKAMHKDPARRYQSAEQLSEDIRRYLGGLPIIARPDTLTYRAAKFIRRQRLGVAAAAALFVALVGGIGVSTWEARRADTEAATANAVNEFLQNDLLAQASVNMQSRPNTKPDPDLKVRTALDRAGSQIAGKFGAQPAVEASIRETIGFTYFDLGLFPEAQLHLERAFELRHRTLGQDGPESLPGMGALAQLYLYQGKYAQARPLFTRVLELRRRILGPQHRDTLAALNDLGELYSFEGDDARAESLLGEAMEGKRKVLGPEDPETLETMSNLAVVYRIEGKYAQAESLLNKAVEIENRVLGPEHPNTLTGTYELAVVYMRQGKYAQAEPNYRSVIASYRRTLGEEHPWTLTAMNGLVGVYQAKQKYTEAEALATHVVEVRRRVLGEDHPDTLNSRNLLAELFRRHGKYEQAETLFRSVLESRRRVLGAQHRDTAATLLSLGLVRVLQGKYAGAESPLREALTIYEKLNSAIWSQYYTQSVLGASLAGQQKYAESEPLLLGGYWALVERQNRIPADWPAVEQAEGWIVRLYTEWGNSAKAAAWREKLHTSKPLPLP